MCTPLPKSEWWPFFCCWISRRHLIPWIMICYCWGQDLVKRSGMVWKLLWRSDAKGETWGEKNYSWNHWGWCEPHSVLVFDWRPDPPTHSSILYLMYILIVSCSRKIHICALTWIFCWASLVDKIQQIVMDNNRKLRTEESENFFLLILWLFYFSKRLLQILSIILIWDIN
jgi:hypothetical protein